MLEFSPVSQNRSGRPPSGSPERITSPFPGCVHSGEAEKHNEPLLQRPDTESLRKIWIAQLADHLPCSRRGRNRRSFQAGGVMPQVVLG